MIIKICLLFHCFKAVLVLSCSESNPTEAEFKNSKNLNIVKMSAVVETMELLLDNTTAGSSEGQFPASSRNKMETQLNDSIF